MNYKKHYDLLIERGKNRVLDGYVERHHIIPQCMGGGDERENLIQLTPEEHYVAHQLLVKIYPDVVGLASAAQLMTVHHTDLRTTNKLFGWIRKKCAIDASIHMTKWYKENEHPRGFLGKNHTSDIKNQIAKTTKESMTESVGVRVYVYNLNGTFYKEFRTLTECAEHLKTSPSNVKYTAEGKVQHCAGKQIRYDYTEKVSKYKNPNEGKVYDIVCCPHCGKQGGGPSIKRWHFDNCKNKELV